jgi:hypothetical protein
MFFSPQETPMSHLYNSFKLFFSAINPLLPQKITILKSRNHKPNPPLFTPKNAQNLFKNAEKQFFLIDIVRYAEHQQNHENILKKLVHPNQITIVFDYVD